MAEQTQHQTALDGDEQQVGALYAKALLAAAGGNTDEIVSQLEAVVKECLDRFPALEQALGSPNIAQEEKEAMLDRIFGGKLDKLLLNFIKVLCRRGRAESLRAVQVTASMLRDEQLGRLHVQVTSALTLDDAQRNAIRAQLKTAFGKDAVLEEHTDAALLGGIVLRIGDKVYDGSVLGKMQQLRQSVLSGVQRSMRSSFDTLVSS
jgi:F-type H+-transporting ATPase subunit delta